MGLIASGVSGTSLQTHTKLVSHARDFKGNLTLKTTTHDSPFLLFAVVDMGCYPCPCKYTWLIAVSSLVTVTEIGS